MRADAKGDDCARLLALLRAFALEQASHQRCELLRAAIDLFDLSQRIDGAVTATQRIERDALFDLIETVEMSDPRSRLFVTRGLELKLHLESHLRRHALPSNELGEAHPLHARRKALRERADALLARSGAGLPIAA